MALMSQRRWKWSICIFSTESLEVWLVVCAVADWQQHHQSVIICVWPIHKSSRVSLRVSSGKTCADNLIQWWFCVHAPVTYQGMTIFAAVDEYCNVCTDITTVILTCVVRHCCTSDCRHVRCFFFQAFADWVWVPDTPRNSYSYVRIWSYRSEDSRHLMLRCAWQSDADSGHEVAMIYLMWLLHSITILQWKGATLSTQNAIRRSRRPCGDLHAIAGMMWRVRYIEAHLANEWSLSRFAISPWHSLSYYIYRIWYISGRASRYQFISYCMHACMLQSLTDAYLSHCDRLHTLGYIFLSVLLAFTAKSTVNEAPRHLCHNN